MDINDRREITTRKRGNGRTHWLRINHDREALALWSHWVVTAPNQDEMIRRADIAFADERRRVREPGPQA